MNPIVNRVTERIQKRSRASREIYLKHITDAASDGPVRQQLSCTNLAHAFAASTDQDKLSLSGLQRPNVAIVSAYNDMLSAHQPLSAFPSMIKDAVRKLGATAQFAGGVPAMCDGVTQGQPGMELSLFSRDVIAMSTAIALSHNTFDSTLCLGVCDKIVPGLLIGALSFGHLPTIFVPAGPMTSGLPNHEKAKTRQLFAEGKIGREELLAAETQSYHGPGTCTFYGTANSNQMLMEIMGLHIPGAAFINPNTSLRFALTQAAAQRSIQIIHGQAEYSPVGEIVNEQSLVNGMVGLLATGGSTNHVIHLVAIARAAGIRLDIADLAELSAIVPLLCRIYPNGQADINQFHAAGGMAFLIRQLIDVGLLHTDVKTVIGQGLEPYAEEPGFDESNQLTWRKPPNESLDFDILSPAEKPFSKQGGLKLLSGNLGRAVVKVSAVDPQYHRIQAPARVFDDQQQLVDAFAAGALDMDFVAVLRFQGPAANGMPELHKLMPPLAVLLDRGYKVALVTDGRLSGASGKVLSAIHVCPETIRGSLLGKVKDGDLIEVDAQQNLLNLKVDQDELDRRSVAPTPPAHSSMGTGLFAGMRERVTSSEFGASFFGG